MKNLVRMLVCVLALSGGFLDARSRGVLVPRNDRNFYDLITKYQFAAVLFYQDSKVVRRDAGARQVIDFMNGTFDRLGRYGYYRDADLVFMKVNVERDNLADVSHAFQIVQLPCVVLFKSGVPIQDRYGKPLMLVGSSSADQIERLIKSNLKKELDANVQKRAEERRQQRELDRLYGPSFSWGLGWGWPGAYYGSWGWPGYYGGWGWGGYGGGWRGGCGGGGHHGGGHHHR